ncbi:hypothetical protein H6F98_25460 [Microcoleus sp. FACHB-SPT15]|jgi:hypothetical protein|uniref:hypothetical protein n=1 Tax=Microcoleus sp. FACHB-SPT15 TaxID=2692830 RepID=UPI00177EDE37|nr:hypothetical protein [Microcoleus sp. FACHB-SPT15]MBD1808777.1 hypothetical protein [Microcoleus sp. FACHB-SPT15]
MPISPRQVYSHLRKLDQTDIATSALTRELAQDLLANPGISLRRKQVIAERLHRANTYLGMQATADGDSY